MLRERAVQDAVDDRLDELAPDVRRQLLGDRHDARRIERVAHRDVDADRQPLDRLERRLAVGARAALRAIDLVAQRKAAELVDAGEAPSAQPSRSVETPPVRRLMRTPTSPGETERTGLQREEARHRSHDRDDRERPAVRAPSRTVSRIPSTVAHPVARNTYPAFRKNLATASKIGRMVCICASSAATVAAGAPRRTSPRLRAIPRTCGVVGAPGRVRPRSRRVSVGPRRRSPPRGASNVNARWRSP